MTRKTPSRTKSAATAASLQLTQGKLAALLGITQQRVSQLCQQGLFTSLASGKINAWAAVPAYVRSIKERPDDGSRQLRERRTALIDLRLRRESRDLISAAEINEPLAEIIMVFRNELTGLPAGVTRDLDLRRVIESYIGDMLDRLRQKFDALEDAAKSGRECFDDEGDGDGED